jgi:hypothetical protein
MPPVEARTVPHHRYVHLRWDAPPWLLIPLPFLAAPVLRLAAVAVALAFFACFGGELAVDDWTVNARAPPAKTTMERGRRDRALLLIFTALLTLAAAAHGVSG